MFCFDAESKCVTENSKSNFGASVFRWALGSWWLMLAYFTGR